MIFPPIRPDLFPIEDDLFGPIGQKGFIFIDIVELPAIYEMDL